MAGPELRGNAASDPGDVAGPGGSGPVGHLRHTQGSLGFAGVAEAGSELVRERYGGRQAGEHRHDGEATGSQCGIVVKWTAVLVD